ncbi:hypothetical protein KIPB_001323, partial [Kipferlia bialata]
ELVGFVEPRFYVAPESRAAVMSRMFGGNTLSAKDKEPVPEPESEAESEGEQGDVSMEESD